MKPKAPVKLARGLSVVCFPEGTTTTGEQVARFHAGLLQAARDSGRRVQPVAIHYREAGHRSRRAAFVDDDDFVSHLNRLLRGDAIIAEVIFCAPLSPLMDRRTLAREAERAVRGQIAANSPAA